MSYLNRWIGCFLLGAAIVNIFAGWVEMSINHRYHIILLIIGGVLLVISSFTKDLKQ